MTQLSFFITTDTQNQKLYCYTNNYPQIVTVKIMGLADKIWQRIVFPTEKFLFIADDSCQIKVNKSSDKDIIQEVINCSDLAVV